MKTQTITGECANRSPFGEPRADAQNDHSFSRLFCAGVIRKELSFFMNQKKIYDAITNVPDNLVEEASNTKLKRTYAAWKKWTAMAAGLAIIIGIASIIPRLGNKSGDALYNVVFPKAYAFDDLDARRTIRESNPVEASFLKALNDFSYITAARVFSDSRENVNYSPLSLYFALAMATSGAGGETLNEFLALLGVPDRDTLSEQCGNLYRLLYFDNKIGRLKIGNSLWMHKGIKWKNDFIKNAAESFYAHSYSVDFTDEQSTGRAMGKWVSDNTNGTLTPQFDIKPEQILAIINTVYFYDEWNVRFEESWTKEDVFYISDSTAVSCDFMNSTHYGGSFYHGNNYTRATLGLKNWGQMIFILPDEGVSVNELLATPVKMQAVFEEGKYSNGAVLWQIPKFSFGSMFDDMKETLQSLGITTAFNIDDADFSGITDEIAYITSICQETRISIDEKGVEASAYTKVDITGGSSGGPQDMAEMILNRPFIFGITAPNGTLLFVGGCENPLAG